MPTLTWLRFEKLLMFVSAGLFALFNIAGIFVTVFRAGNASIFYTYEQFLMWPMLVVSAFFFIGMVLFRWNPSSDVAAVPAAMGVPAVAAQTGWTNKWWKLLVVAVIAIMVVVLTVIAIGLLVNALVFGAEWTTAYFIVLHLVFAVGLVFLTWANKP